MGQASSIVNGPGQSKALPPFDPDQPAHGGVIRQLTHITDDLDLAISTKEHDLQHEGNSLAAENHYKLGILRGATALIRRAKAILEDYNRVLNPDGDVNDLEEDIDIALAANGKSSIPDDPDDLP